MTQLRLQRLTRLLVVAGLVHSVATTTSSTADACGCLAPPLPSPGEVDFAVNQQAEQIIFEVDEGFINAHVLIKYAGAPESFGWLVPVPTVPELELSFAGVFGLIDQQTAPAVTVQQRDVCPSPVYFCQQHPFPSCSGITTNQSGGSPGAAATGSAAGMSSSDSATLQPNGAPPVVVYAREQIGAYDTVVLGSGDAQAIVTWLTDNGFIVNDTMTPYMQPYLDQDMLFVAARLVPGAGVDEIRPLRMRYAGTEPMIPLQLTAVAAEPHLTVTAYIYSNTPFQPIGKSVVEVDAADVAWTSSLRTNYPMLLGRTIDEAGRDAFVREYGGAPPRYLDNAQGCCDGTAGGFAATPTPTTPMSEPDGGVAPDSSLSAAPDVCGIANDGLCQCPRTQFDQADCAEDEELSGTIALATQLADKYTYMTRLTTRLSPEEMTFDPAFEATDDATTGGRLSLTGSMNIVSRCEMDVIDVEERAVQRALQDCAGLYCDAGECGATELGVGCVCDAGFVARTFTDLDGQTSLTCVPEQSTVDLAAGGVDIPDVCGAFPAPESGECVTVAGFAAVRCEEGQAAVLGAPGTLPTCEDVTEMSGGAGAVDNTDVLAEIQICQPPPPVCSAFGWLERFDDADIAIDGVECDSSIPDPSWFDVPPMPTCDDVDAVVPASADSTTASGTPAGSPNTVSAFSTSMPTTAARPEVMRRGGGCSVASLGHAKASILGAFVLGAFGLLGRRRRRH